MRIITEDVISNQVELELLTTASSETDAILHIITSHYKHIPKSFRSANNKDHLVEADT